MTVTWTISHSDRLVTTTLAGTVAPVDLERYLADVAAAGGMTYRKVIDLTLTRGDLRLAELKAMMRSTEQYAKAYVLGAVAIIVASDFSEDAAALYAKRTHAERPYRIVHDLAEAMAWLDADPPRTVADT